LRDTAIELDTASAIETLAPASAPRKNAVRAPSPAGESGTATAGRQVDKLDKPAAGRAGPSSSLLQARSLQDWEVEDFVLLATVDGSIHARDRRTGAARWALEVDQPMVETIYHRENVSLLESNGPLDDLLWIVEPSKDGDIYVYNQAKHGMLQRLHMTVKQLSHLTPYSGEDPAVVYNAEMRTAMYTVDAATGTLLKESSSRGSSFNDAPTCRRINAAGLFEEEECGNMGTLTLGRIEYTIRINYKDGQPICTLRYLEWATNTRDGDLHSQYTTTMDQNYVYSMHDGHVFGFNHAAKDRPPQWKQKLPSPVVRVFDVVRPNSAGSLDAALAILPQPAGPLAAEHATSKIDDDRIFVNHVDSRGWYALSEHTYPMVTGGAPDAQCYSKNWLSTNKRAEKLTRSELQHALVGVHPLNTGGPTSKPEDRIVLTISGPSDTWNVTPPTLSTDVPLPPSSSVLSESYLLGKAAQNPIDIFIVVFFIIVLTLATVNRRHIYKVLRQRLDISHHLKQLEIASTSTTPTRSQFPKLVETKNVIPDVIEVPEKVGETSAEGNVDDLADDLQTPTVSRRNTLEVPGSGNRSRSPSLAEKRGRANGTPHVRIFEPSPSPGPGEDGESPGQETPTGEKKKARRGCRGGKALKKRKGSKSQTDDELVEVSVKAALQIGQKPPLMEPDVVAVSSPDTNSSPMDPSHKNLQIGHLIVYTETALGFGSHGTKVFKGSFSGREVAVKRMLKEFYEVASHEVGLLQESDDHPNVIRYYDKESAGEFLYIALELCPASLLDVIERQVEFKELVGPHGLDHVDSLRQITLGIRYLHDLKIVHRDIKPENILLGTPKRIPTKPHLFQPPRLLISDFGLCKKLEIDQSSFRATTAHAAGTSGWRAPELLVDDDDNDTRANDLRTPTSSSVTSTASEPVVLDTATNRRATRAIDIFALGCVFYYVLSGGNHPFDGKGRGEGKYMREANIIKAKYSLDELAVLGHYQWEARDLVGRMLAHDPRLRPDAGRVLAHPFFWSAADRLDFLCHVSDQFEFEAREPPSAALLSLERVAPRVLPPLNRGAGAIVGDFLRALPTDFVATLGRQRKYQGDRMLDLLRALRNKRNHYEDMPEAVKAKVGSLPEGYLLFWTGRFPELLMACHEVVRRCGWEERDRFRRYFRVD